MDGAEGAPRGVGDGEVRFSRESWDFLVRNRLKGRKEERKD